MPNGEYTRYATQREFDDFRQETRDELKWLRRGVIWVLAAAIGGNLVSTVTAILLRPSPVP